MLKCFFSICAIGGEATPHFFPFHYHLLLSKDPHKSKEDRQVKSEFRKLNII